MFLWHFPWDCSRLALPGALPCGGRTFLIRRTGPPDATVLPRRRPRADSQRTSLKNAGRRHLTFAAHLLLGYLRLSSLTSRAALLALFSAFMALKHLDAS